VVDCLAKAKSSTTGAFGRQGQVSWLSFGIDSQGNPVVKTGCPFTGTQEVSEPGNNAFHEPSNQ